MQTVKGIAWRYGWKRADAQPGASPVPLALPGLSVSESPKTKGQPILNQGPADTIGNALKGFRTRSKLALATYTAKASETLARVKPGARLANTKKAVDLANVHSVLWPEAKDKDTSFLAIGVLIGTDKPTRHEP